uniref:DUF6291 domain-containing protein n=1 Tax=Siphoviridae sp. ctzm5103 TaxID=2825750 RepID=A0A8S5TT89_9CAUD|nr:MAG TPA: hypothetical protein [Siphoviridae sp. ctzm5103]
MKKAYFQYYETFETIIEKIKDNEEREQLRKVIINYGLHGTAPESFHTEALEIAWTVCKDLIDQQQHRREVNAANRAGKKADPSVIIRINNGAEEIERPLQNPEPEEKAAQEIQPEKPKRKNFVKPTVEEIAAYCKEKNYNVNAQQFFNYYESNGWKIGRNAMKSWQAAVQNWNTRDKANNKAAGTMWANNSTDADTAGYEDLF